MSKSTDTPTKSQPQATSTPRPVRKRKFIFPDIEGGGPAVTIEATSLEEATEIYKKGQAEA